jgi:BirA family biotin operon repressor/biotin-[acetyl-CoA-carboxylase] ligase
MTVSKGSDLSAATIRHHLTQFGGTVIVKPVLQSTQDFAKQYWQTRQPNQAVAVIADRQRAAYGKAGRSFYAPGGTGIYLSLLWPDEAVGEPGLLTTGVGVGVVRALRQCCPESDVRLKWVNDVYCRGKKVAGILTERLNDFSNGRSACVIGIGINLTTISFPDSLGSTAGSVAPGQKVDRNQLVAHLLDQLTLVRAEYRTGDLLAEYRRYSLLLGRRVRLSTGCGELTGRVTGIDDQAHLLVRDDWGHVHRLISGEVDKVYF